MDHLVGLTRGGKTWTPRFVVAVDGDKCIGCGRCMKICAQGVLEPAEVDEDDSAKMFCALANPQDCIGCQACGRTCKKEAFTFEPLAA